MKSTPKISRPRTAAGRCLERLVRLSAEDVRNLKEACGRRGYALPRMNPRTGTMLNAQWRSWKKLERHRLADIEPSGGEAEDLVITDKGRLALANSDYQTDCRISKPASD